MHGSHSLLQPFISTPTLILRPPSLASKMCFWLLLNLYYRTTCTIRQHFHDYRGHLKIEAPYLSLLITLATIVFSMVEVSFIFLLQKFNVLSTMASNEMWYLPWSSTEHDTHQYVRWCPIGTMKFAKAQYSTWRSVKSGTQHLVQQSTILTQKFAWLWYSPWSPVRRDPEPTDHSVRNGSECLLDSQTRSVPSGSS